MTDAPPSKTDGTTGTNGTTLICRDNCGPATDSGTGTNGTASVTPGAQAQALVPLVPLQGAGTGPKNINELNAVPAVPVVPSENGNDPPDLFAAFEALFAAFEARDAVPKAEAGNGNRFETADALSPDPRAFVERVAILVSEAGLAQEEAEAAAAREQGYADVFAYAEAVVAVWRRAVDTAQPPIQDATCWEDLRQVAIDFLDGPVAACAARSGWTPQALFGVVPTDAGHYLPIGAVFRQPQEGRLFAFDSEVALYRHADGAWHPRYLTEFDTTGTVLLWEATGPP